MERFDTKEMIFREEQYLRQKEMGQELRHNLELKELEEEYEKRKQEFNTNYLMERFITKGMTFREEQELRKSKKLEQEFQENQISKLMDINLKEELNIFYDKLSSNKYKESNESLNILQITKILKESSIIIDINNKEKKRTKIIYF